MSTPAAGPADEIRLEIEDDPRMTPLVQRLAQEYWEIVRSNAERVGFPIARAWVRVDVDMEDVTRYLFTVHSPVTHERAWAFHRSLRLDVTRWDEQMATADREVGRRLALWVVGLKRAQSDSNGA